MVACAWNDTVESMRFLQKGFLELWSYSFPSKVGLGLCYLTHTRLHKHFGVG
jgi:hypothetical protein